MTAVNLSAVLLLMLAGITILMAIITGEALFPAAHTTSHNTISDLGSTWQPGSLGGIERWVAYAVVLWIVAFGGYLLGSVPKSQEPQFRIGAVRRASAPDTTAAELITPKPAPATS